MLLQYNELYLFHRMFVLTAACIHAIQCSCEHYTETSRKARVIWTQEKGFLKWNLIWSICELQRTTHNGVVLIPVLASLNYRVPILSWKHQRVVHLLFSHLAALCIVIVTLNPYLRRYLCISENGDTVAAIWRDSHKAVKVFVDVISISCSDQPFSFGMHQMLICCISAMKVCDSAFFFYISNSYPSNWVWFY